VEILSESLTLKIENKQHDSFFQEDFTLFCRYLAIPRHHSFVYFGCNLLFI